MRKHKKIHSRNRTRVNTDSSDRFRDIPNFLGYKKLTRNVKIVSLIILCMLFDLQAIKSHCAEMGSKTKNYLRGYRVSEQWWVSIWTLERGKGATMLSLKFFLNQKYLQVASKKKKKEGNFFAKAESFRWTNNFFNILKYIKPNFMWLV